LKPIHTLCATLLSLLLLGTTGMAAAQQNVNIRGTLTAFDGQQLSIKTRDGRDVQVDLPAEVNVAATKAFSLGDIKPGMVLGVTTVKRGVDVVAIDVRPIPSTARQGLSPFDLQPESTMTNAVVEGTAVQAPGGNGNALTLTYPGGNVMVLVPPGTPMSQSMPGSRADLKLGEGIFAAVRQGEGGKLIAVRVQVGKDGVRPTQ
jgi:hypothetical protein